MAAYRISHAVGDLARVGSRETSFTRVVLILVLVGGLLFGCQLVPSKPDAVFILYRDRMKSENLAQARELLSEESRNLAVALESEYKLDQPPEALALLNTLDPTSIPTVMQSGDTLALLQVRTLKGGLRLVRMVRKDPTSHWTLDITEELKSLKAFLDARGALEIMKDQASEYAASWKAFNDQLKKMNPTDTEPPKISTPPKPPPRPALRKPVNKPKPKRDNPR
jgi:hypothetical protein